jgi:Flp pilus assembly protein TadD
MSQPPSLAQAVEWLRLDRPNEAAALCEAFLAREPESVEALRLLARARLRQQRFDDMCLVAERAAAIQPADASTQLQLIEALIMCGRNEQGLAQVHALERHVSDSQFLGQLGHVYTLTGQHYDAERCYRSIVALSPDNPRALYNLAATLIATGNLAEAELLLDRVIALTPEDSDAWHSRSTLRTQTTERNHVPALREQLERRPTPAGQVALGYALAKELEDLGEYEESFKYLQLGARTRKSQLSYRVAGDVSTMEHIQRVFTEEYFRNAEAGCASLRPIFVLGLPRSGTTLVDRILSSHSEVGSLGEIRDFALALVRTARSEGARPALVEASVRLDPSELGLAYAQSSGGYGVQKPRLIDKTPLNFLYLGLIHTALPNARIVHLRRNPMDSCFAMYKTLFRAAYPFSYDLDDLASYYVAYHRLMQHWRTVIPQAFLDVDYESLVLNQEAESRRILEYCGLEWQPGCLEFHRNESPAATASAAQVRQPMYRNAVQRWRLYQARLTPLVSRLENAGICCA